VSRRTPERGTLALLLSAEGGHGRVALADFEAWCQAHVGRRVRVWLAGELMVPVLAEPGLAFADEAAFEAWARRVLQHYGHEADGALATWRSASTAGACLLQGVALDTLRAQAARHGVQLLSVQPWWCTALQGLPAHGEHTLLVAECRTVTVVSLARGGVTAVQQHWLAHAQAAELAQLAAELSGRCIGYGVEGLDEQARLPGAAADPGPPDFITAAPPRARALGWALAATGACVLALAGADAHDAWQAAHAAPDEPAAPFTQAEAQPGDAAAHARLAHPWPTVIAAAEATVPGGGHWLGLEHQAGQRELRLTGIAASLPDALAAAEAVSRSAGMAQALVARSAAAGAGGGVEFTLKATLAP
jgi:hypothetical protein